MECRGEERSQVLRERSLSQRSVVVDLYRNQQEAKEEQANAESLLGPSRTRRPFAKACAVFSMSFQVSGESESEI